MIESKDIVKVAQEEIDIFERPSVMTSEALMKEVTVLRGLLNEICCAVASKNTTVLNTLVEEAKQIRKGGG